MEGLLIIVGVGVLLGGGAVLRQKANNWAINKGQERSSGQFGERTSGSRSEELGTALWFSSAAAGYPLVRSVVSKALTATEVNPNLWHKAETADDSLQISWEPNGAGAYLLVRRAKAHGTMLVGMRWWKKSLNQIEKDAAKQGIQVQRVAGQLQHTAHDGEHQVWTR